MRVIGSVLTALGLLWFLLACAMALTGGALSTATHLVGGGLMCLIGLQMVQVTLLQRPPAPPEK
jgi:hypothetical protein